MKPYRSFGNDLYFDLQCNCPDKRFEDSAVSYLFKTVIKLTGYSDRNFFDNVNKEPRFGECECGRKFQYQWFVEGVEAKFLD
jgi:hypothetical protein